MKNKVKEKVNLIPYIIGLAALVLVGLGIIKLVALNNNTDYYFQLASPATYDQPLVITSFSHIFSIQPVNAKPAQIIQETDNVIRYINAYDNTDVVQTRYTDKLKEDIILKQPGHPDKFEYRINLDQYDFIKTSNGDFIFYEKGKAGDELAKIFTIPAPYMIDNNNAKSPTTDVKTTLTKEGILTLEPSLVWLKSASYPVILDPTIEINIINIYSHPQAGDTWEVEFTTHGQADLRIIPDDQATIDDDEFVSLACDGAIVEPQILAGDIIYYLNWQCDGIGKIVHHTLKVGNHALEFQFGDQIAYAYNGPAKVKDPEKKVKDKQVLKELQRQGMDPDYVELEEDYDAKDKDGKAKHVYSTIYKDRKSNKRIMETSGLPRARKFDGKKIEPSFELRGNKYHARPNLFDMVVDGTEVTVKLLNDQPPPTNYKKNDFVKWNPQLFIGGVEQPVISGPTLLPIDPINENYFDNTIDWDYGVATRRLRIIEGHFREWWIFNESPREEVRIKHNQQGNIKLNLGSGSDADNERLSIIVENEDEEVLLKQDVINAEYPIKIGASLTVYPDGNPETDTVDGQVAEETNNQVWGTLKGNGGTRGDSADNNEYVTFIRADTNSNRWWVLTRTIYLFDTSAIPDSATIIAGTMSIYGRAAGMIDGLSITPSVNIYSSAPASNTELVAGDFDSLGTTAYSTTISYAGWDTSDYNDFLLNSNGRSQISKTGITKFGARNTEYDVGASTPTWSSGQVYSGVDSFMSEKGAGYEPKLVVTYSIADGGACSTGDDCTSGLCINAICRAGGSCSSYEGYGCSNDATTWSDAAAGTCLTDATCKDTGDIATDCGTSCSLGTGENVYASCDGRGSDSCDTDAGGNFVQDGMCFDDGGAVDGTNFDCETAGYIFYTDSIYDDGDDVTTAIYDWDSDNWGEGCDDTLTSGGDFESVGMVTTTGCTSGTGGSDIVRVDASNNNYFVATCDSSGDICDYDIAASLNSPWLQTGLCADNSCDGSDVAKISSTYYSCDASADGYACETSPSSGTFSQDSMCLSDTNDGGSWDCKTSGQACFDDTYYEDTCASCSAANSCTSTLASGDYSASGICLSDNSCDETSEAAKDCNYEEADCSNYYASCGSVADNDRCDTSITGGVYSEDGVCSSGTCTTLTAESVGAGNCEDGIDNDGDGTCDDGTGCTGITTADPDCVLTVTTESATNLSTTSVTGNGNITAGTSITTRGFKYATVATSTCDSWSVSEDGSFGTGVYSLPITGLTKGEIYFYRAYASIDALKTSYGSCQSFNTTITATPIILKERVILKKRIRLK